MNEGPHIFYKVMSMGKNMKQRLWRKIWGLFLCVVLGTAGLKCRAEEQPTLYAEAAVLMDAASGRILYGKNADEVLPMASTTKIMTCILLLERLDETEEAEVSAYAASMPKVKLGVRRGEVYRVQDLLYSLMLESHNDVAVVLAEYVGKQFLSQELQQKATKDFTEQESGEAVACFVNLMNEKAAEIGCRNTHFLTPNGLDASEIISENGEEILIEHTTTASDLAAIMRYCIQTSEKCEEFLQLTAVEQYSFSANKRSFSLTNHNSFLQMMQGALTGKTGYTGKAGYCYVGALQRGEKTLIVALLACGWPGHKSWKWSDTKKLMEYGLDHYEYYHFDRQLPALPKECFGPIPVLGGETDACGEVCMLGLHPQEKQERQPEGILLSEEEEIGIHYSLPKALEAPIAENQVVGKVSYSVDGQVYQEIFLVTDTSVEKITLFWSIRQIMRRYLL